MSMAILSSHDAPTMQVSFVMGCWVANFINTLAGLFITLFLVVSHEDLQQGNIEPMELSNSLLQVSIVLRGGLIIVLNIHLNHSLIKPFFVVFALRLSMLSDLYGYSLAHSTLVYKISEHPIGSL